MNSEMVYKFIFCFERLLLPGTLLPVASMICYFRSTNMINGEVGYNIVHGGENFSTALSCFFADPFTGHLLLDRFSHVAKERGSHSIHVGTVHVVMVAITGTTNVRKE